MSSLKSHIKSWYNNDYIEQSAIDIQWNILETFYVLFIKTDFQQLFSYLQGQVKTFKSKHIQFLLAKLNKYIKFINIHIFICLNGK